MDPVDKVDIGKLGIFAHLQNHIVPGGDPL
jgi:hypothetical protein